MTTIVFRKGILSVDRKVKVAIGNHSYYTDADKYFKVDDKIVGAITGDLPLPEKLKTITDGLIALSLDAEAGKEKNVELIKKVDELLDFSTCIWMTKRFVYLLEGCALYQYPMDVQFARGAGMFVADALMENNVPLEELYAKISKIDCLTGSAYNSFKMRDLRVMGKRK